MRLASSLQKLLGWHVKKLEKNAEFHADFKYVEKVLKNAPKSYKQNKFDEHK